MKKITKKDIKNIHEYEKIREKFRKKIIEIKNKRRIEVSDRLAFLFENRETVIFQIEEMIRAEKIITAKGIQDEIDVYNDLIPAKNELSATMFIQITEKEKIKEYLDSLMGIDGKDTVYFKINDERIYGIFEEGHSKEDKISAVHFVKFKFKPTQIKAFKSSKNNIYLVVEHPNYKNRKEIDLNLRRELTKDFE
jgi:hypothetical protein